MSDIQRTFFIAGPMSKHRKQAENWLRKNCQNALEMSLKCFETMSADERISVLQYGILNDQSQGRNGKRKTIKTMKRIFLNINRSLQKSHSKFYFSKNMGDMAILRLNR